MCLEIESKFDIVLLCERIKFHSFDSQFDLHWWVCVMVNLSNTNPRVSQSPMKSKRHLRILLRRRNLQAFRFIAQVLYLVSSKPRLLCPPPAWAPRHFVSSNDLSHLHHQLSIYALSSRVVTVPSSPMKPRSLKAVSVTLALTRNLVSLSSLLHTTRLTVRWVEGILGILALLRGKKVAWKVKMWLSKLFPNPRLSLYFAVDSFEAFRIWSCLRFHLSFAICSS